MSQSIYYHKKPQFIDALIIGVQNYYSFAPVNQYENIGNVISFIGNTVESYMISNNTKTNALATMFGLLQTNINNNMAIYVGSGDFDIEFLTNIGASYANIKS